MLTDAMHEQKREERDTQAAAIRQLELRVAALELANRELSEAFVTSTRAASNVFEQMASHNTALSRGQMDEMRDLRVEIAKLTSVCADMRERQVETFRFARERETLPPVLPKQPKLDS